MLVLRCKPGHSIHIDVKANVDPATPVGHLFGHSGISIYIGYSDREEVRLAVQAPPSFNVVHSKELT